MTGNPFFMEKAESKKLIMFCTIERLALSR